MTNLLARLNGNAALAGFAAHLNAGFLSEDQTHLAEALLSEDQQHLFTDWDAPGIRDADKHAFLNTLLTAHQSYPGGLAGYIHNARTLLAQASSGANPFEGCTPTQPDLVDLSAFGNEYDQAEELGLR